MQQDEERLIKIETVLSEHERLIEELNEVIISQGKMIDHAVKPLSEETPPPHY